MNTEYLKLSIFDPEEGKLEKIVKVLSNEGLVVFPTETVYGIGFDTESKAAMDRIEAIKKERQDKPYSISIPDFSWIKDYRIDKDSLNRAHLIEDLLPGPITFIVKIEDGSKLGIRVPMNRITQDAITLFKKPIYLPSANISGGVPAKNAQEAMDCLWGRVDLIVDGGCCTLCVASLVLDLTQNPVKILREGPLFFTTEVKKRFSIE
ncbi:MAG: L-threonylcarbamoyladenylate synthase [Candidatus Kaelpia imicola]|nr:L-threonylcarbamoyladenylate synthase [Candidatus Kaelpia imicola]